MLAVMFQQAPPPILIDSTSFQAVIDRAAHATADSLYIDFLQRVNQQLGPLSNPYGIMVAAFGVLFAAGAIIAAFIIWRQGREYRRLLDGEIEKYRGVLDALVGEKVQEMKRQVEAAIASAEEQLTDATGEQKERLEGELRRLEAARKKLSIPPSEVGTPRGTIHISGDLSSGFGLGSTGSLARGLGGVVVSAPKKKMKCAHCGHEWELDVSDGTFRFPEWSEECPECGTGQWVDRPATLL